MRATVRLAGMLMAAAVVVGVLGFRAESAAGQAGIAFGIRPANGSPTDSSRGAYFIFEGSPGQSIADEALVTTTSKDPLPLAFYTADAITASGGGTAFAQPGQNVSGERAWVTTGITSLSVTADSPATVPFTVQVPAEAAPGDHVIGLIVEAAPRSSGTAGGVQTTVTERAGVAIVVRVPGDLFEKLTLGAFCINTTRGSNYLEIPVFNEGNVLTRGKGTFRLFTDKGQHVFERPVELQTIMAPGATMLRVFPPQVIPPGKYRAMLDLEPAGGGPRATMATELQYTSKEVNSCEIIAPDTQPGDVDTSRDNFAGSESSGTDLSAGVFAIGGLLGVIVLLLAALLTVTLRERRRPPAAP